MQKIASQQLGVAGSVALCYLLMPPASALCGHRAHALCKTCILANRPAFRRTVRKTDFRPAVPQPGAVVPHFSMALTIKLRVCGGYLRISGRPNP